MNSANAPSFIRRSDSKHFLYCLYLQDADKLYWGVTSNLEQRMCQHNDWEVESTRDQGNIWILFTKPFSSREEAERAERLAWSVSGCTQPQGLICAGTVRWMNVAYSHLIDLGWRGTRIRLRDFVESIKTIEHYLNLWDSLDENFISEGQLDNHLTQTLRNEANFHQIAQRGENIPRLLRQEITCFATFVSMQVDNQEVVFADITNNFWNYLKTSLNISCYENIKFFSILHIEAYETLEEAEHRVKELNRNQFKVIEDFVDAYQFLLKSSWSGRRVNLISIGNRQPVSRIGSFCKLKDTLDQASQKQIEINERKGKSYASGRVYNRLKEEKKRLISKYQDLLKDLKIKRLSTSDKITWETIIVPPELLQQRVHQPRVNHLHNEIENPVDWRRDVHQEDGDSLA